MPAKNYIKRVQAVQWEYDGKGGPYGPLPEGFALNPPPTDFGVPRSAYNKDLGLTIHPTDYVVFFRNTVQRMDQRTFEANFTEEHEGLRGPFTEESLQRAGQDWGGKE